MPEPSERAAPSRGELWVVSAPSGAGKTTLVRALLDRDPRLTFSISYTTRPPRHSERHGHDYFFVPEPEFLAMVERGEFLEHARVFDRWYGTGRTHVEQLLASGRHVLLEIDWQGARQVRERAPDSHSVFILPPSVAELERRLRGRGTDSAETIARRLRDALADMSHWAEFEHLVVNDDFAAALDRLAAIVAGRETGFRTALPAVQAAAQAIVQP
jgi:guanylate kinase